MVVVCAFKFECFAFEVFDVEASGAQASDVYVGVDPFSLAGEVTTCAE